MIKVTDLIIGPTAKGIHCLGCGRFFVWTKIEGDKELPEKCPECDSDDVAECEQASCEF